MKGWILAAVVIVVVVAGAVLLYRPSGELCDGDLPVWAADEFEDGCGQPPALYQYLLPWHWNAPTVCIGLCTELAPSRSPA